MKTARHIATVIGTLAGILVGAMFLHSKSSPIPSRPESGKRDTTPTAETSEEALRFPNVEAPDPGTPIPPSQNLEASSRSLPPEDPIQLREWLLDLPDSELKPLLRTPELTAYVGRVLQSYSESGEPNLEAMGAFLEKLNRRILDVQGSAGRS